MYDITIVYKTYGADLPWIKYSLLSINKFVSNYDSIIIYCHDQAINQLDLILKEINMINIRVIPVTYDFHGYIKAGVVKCLSYKDVTTKYIIIIDSDNIFTDYLNLNKLIRDDGKIEWTYSEKTIDSSGPEWTVWKKAYEDMTKTIQNVHYMANGFPFVFTRNSLEEAEHKFKYIHNMDYSEFCSKRLSLFDVKISDNIRGRFPLLANSFNEFEWLGYYCKNFSSDYIFSNNISSRRKEVSGKLIQYWSHGGIDAVIGEIEQILSKTNE